MRIFTCRSTFLYGRIQLLFRVNLSYFRFQAKWKEHFFRFSRKKLNFASHITIRFQIGSNSKKERVKTILLSYLFCSYEFHKIEDNFIFDMLKKKSWPNFQRIKEVFTQKIGTPRPVNANNSRMPALQGR